MLFQYVGDDTAPKVTKNYGYTFVLYGKPVEVTDSKVIQKLRGNTSFIEVVSEGDIQKAPEPVIEEKKTTVSKTFDLPPLKEDLSELTEEELEKLATPKKKNK